MSALGRSSLPSTGTLVLLFSVLVAAVLAPLMTALIATSRADIGIDLCGVPKTPPALAVRAQTIETVTIGHMRRVSPQFAPSYFEFKVITKGKKRKRSEGTEVRIADFKYAREVLVDPENSWKVRRKKAALFTDSRREAAITWKGFKFDPELYLTFVRSKRGGIASLHTAGDRTTLDLYKSRRRRRTRRRIRIPSIQVARYHAVVSRRQLTEMEIRLAKADVTQIRRVYVGTVIPKVLYGRKATASERGGTGRWDSRTGAEADSLGRFVEKRGSEARISVGSRSTMEAGGIGTLLACFVATAVVLFALVWGLVGVFRNWRRVTFAPEFDHVVRPFSWRGFSVLTTPFLVYWTVCLLALYPGSMSRDSVNQWAQAHGEIRTVDLHPALHTLFIRFVTTFWDSPAIVVLIQIGTLSVLIAFACILLFRLRVHPFVVGVVYFTALLSPRNAFMATVLWKDTLYAAAVFGLSLVLARMILGSLDKLPLRYWLALGVVLALIPLLRHNGLLIFTGVVSLLPFVFWRERRRALYACGMAILLFMGTKFVAFPLAGVATKPDQLSLRISTMHIGHLIQTDAPLADKEYKLLNGVRSLKNRWKRTSAREYTFAPSRFAIRHRSRYLRVGRDLMGRYPLHVLRRQLEVSSYLYRVDGPAWRHMGTGHLGISGHRRFDKAKLGLVRSPLLQSVTPVVEKGFGASKKKALKRFLWAPAWHLYLSIIGAVTLLYRKRNCRHLVIYAPVFLNTISVLIGATAQHARYQFPVTLAAGTLFALALVPGAKIAEASQSQKDK